MMLYVFHVEVGRMLSFDMTVALSSVENLKETIHRLYGIPSANIILLVSGGEMLTQSTQVSYYSAGTDTNPIFMFLTGDVWPMPAIPPNDTDADLRRQVDDSHSLPAVLDTVRRRAALAARMHELARDEERQCERLVHEQHLQQQGWSAVVANMEDLTNEFRIRKANFFLAFDAHMQKRAGYSELLSNFEDDLKKLARIPILPSLLTLAEADFHGFDDYLDNDDVFSRSQMQQESIVKAAGAPATEATTTGETQDATAGNEASSGTETAVGVVDEKSNSTTTPTKKQKMGDDVARSTTSATATADAQERVSLSSTSSSSRRFTLTLLQWITSKENHNALKLMSEECLQGLSTFNDEIYEKVKADVMQIIKLAELSDVKEIKGLGERLCRLEEIKYKIKKMVQDQKELSTAFQQNQARAINLADPSILPDLCASHQSQLQVMLQNHRRIRDDCRCIAKAKSELGSNLNMRLKRIVWIENTMSELDNRLLFFHRCLRRAERHINIIEQIHRAPSIYVSAVTEVVRRKIFSGEFRSWASKLADDFDSIHGEELHRRQEFNASFEGHFLNILFPGMNDMPPAFANENPLIFDARLPNLTKSDIDVLTTHLPDLASLIHLPDMGPVINFFVSRSGEHQRERMDELLKQQVAAALNQMECLNATEKRLQHQRLGELQKGSGSGSGVGGSVGTFGCDESETDTETEFEKVAETTGGTSTPNLTATVATSTSENALASTQSQTLTVEMISAETLTDENVASLHAEVARLRELMKTMSKTSMECLQIARVNINNLRTESSDELAEVSSKLHMLSDGLTAMRMKCDEIDIEKQAKLTQLVDLLGTRNAELEEERAENKSLNIKCATFEAQLEELRDKLKAAEQEKIDAVAEAREKLINDRRMEIEIMRSHMERSPSDLSLEKLERPKSSADQMVIDLVQHEQLLAQQRVELEAQKERAISEALEKERAIWQTKIFPMNSESVMANVSILKDMLEEKERQLDLFREQDKHLTQDNFQLKTRIEALTNEEGNSWLKEKIDYLNRDKCRLEEELNMEKSKRVEIETSVATFKGTTSERSSSKRYIALDSCSENDLVFVVWSMRHWQYLVVQDSSSLYFVRNDCLTELDLKVPERSEHVDEWTQIPWPFYIIGRVLEKEYCMARKSENRYRVQRGTKFYRVKLAPMVLRVSRRDEELASFSGVLGVSVVVASSGSGGGGDGAVAVATAGAIMPATAATTITTQAAATTTNTTTQTQIKQQESVITEQPTAAVKLLADLGIEPGVRGKDQVDGDDNNDNDDADNDNDKQQNNENVVATIDHTLTSSTTTATTLTTSNATILLASTTDTQQQQQQHKHQQEQTITDMVPSNIILPIPISMSIGEDSSDFRSFLSTTTTTTSPPSLPLPLSAVTTISEDSDEYRSLEAKDENEFSISE